KRREAEQVVVKRPCGAKFVNPVRPEHVRLLNRQIYARNVFQTAGVGKSRGRIRVCRGPGNAPEERVPLIELVVDPAMKLIPIVDARYSRDVVVGRVSGRIRQRVILQGGNANQSEPFPRDYVSGERLPPVCGRVERRGIVDGWAAGEIALALRFGRNAQV